MSIFPGKAIFSPKKPKVVEPEILDEKIDTASEDARKAAQAGAKRRKGRRASILTSARGVSGSDLGSIKQASAGGASVLG